MKDLDELNLDWLAVIHIDGNGLGQIFIKFAEYVEKQTKSACDISTYREWYRRFSKNLDRCTTDAARFALEQMQERWETRLRKMEKRPKKDWLPVVPLILGGDDLTLLCDGRLARCRSSSISCANSAS